MHTTSYTVDTGLAVLILTDVESFQTVVFNFEKGSNSQNHSSDSHHLIEKNLSAKFLIPSLGEIPPNP